LRGKFNLTLRMLARSDKGSARGKRTVDEACLSVMSDDRRKVGCGRERVFMRGIYAKNYVATSGEANFPEQRPKPCRAPLSPGTRAKAKSLAVIGRSRSALRCRLHLDSPQPQLPHAIVGQRTIRNSNKASDCTVVTAATALRAVAHTVTLIELCTIKHLPLSTLLKPLFIDLESPKLF
jgi:hypothetical protein